MLKEFFSELKDLVKGLLKRLMLEERKLYLEEHPIQRERLLHPRPPHPLRPHRRPESTRAISRFIEAVYGAFSSPQSSFVWCMR